MNEGLHISIMALVASVVKKTFHFNFRARTSRGSMTERDCWFVRIVESDNPNCFGIGEAAPLAGLSLEFDDNYEKKLYEFVSQFNGAKVSLQHFRNTDLSALSKKLSGLIPALGKFPSVLFAFETALLDLGNGGSRMIFDNGFLKGKPIAINGLIWMSGLDMMLQQIEIKIQEGFNCIKLKVGGIDFEKECDILQYVRRKYFKMDIDIRLDANGAFKLEEVDYKLGQLAKFDIHSIEQPIKAGLTELKDLNKRSPIPIALDEELIGINTFEEKKALLNRIEPSFIVLKPSLHGALSGCKEWISLAEEFGIGWWMTSALESNIGLNAIAQFTANYDNSLHQGLGTGKIYEDNFESPMTVKSGNLSYSEGIDWTLPDIS